MRIMQTLENEGGLMLQIGFKKKILLYVSFGGCKLQAAPKDDL